MALRERLDFYELDGLVTEAIVWAQVHLPTDSPEINAPVVTASFVSAAQRLYAHTQRRHPKENPVGQYYHTIQWD